MKKFYSLVLILWSVVFLVSCSGGDGDEGPSFKEPTGTVTTLAGSTDGFEDGKGANAKFAGTYGMVSDANGNLYVADFSNNAIRKITPDGVVSTFVGSGVQGSDEGVGTEAQLNGPIDIDIDKDGNFYVLEYSTHRVRKVTKEGSTSTFAGSTNGDAGNADGTGTEARFSTPTSLAVNSDGNIYVTDRAHAIRKITPAGVVTTIVGAITESESDPEIARGFGIDAYNGNLYVADQYNDAILKVTPSGVVTTVADGINAGLNFPLDVTVDKNGNIYVADNDNNRIRKITSAGVITTLAGSSDHGTTDGSGTSAKFWGPYGVHIDDLGNLYVSDAKNYLIRKIK